MTAVLANTTKTVGRRAWIRQVWLLYSKIPYEFQIKSKDLDGGHPPKTPAKTVIGQIFAKNSSNVQW